MNDPALQEAMRLATTLEDAGRLDEAQAAYRRVLALNGEFLPAICGLADTLIKAGCYAEAVESYRTIIARQPVFPDAHNNLGICLQQSGNLAESLHSFHTALTQRPQYPQALNNLGNTFKAMGKFDQAVAAYRKAIEIQPGYVEAMNNLGLSLLAAGKRREAIQTLWQALSLRPNFPDALNSLGKALEEDNQIGPAMQAYHQALQLRPGDSDVLCNLGLLLKRLERFDEAIEAFRRAIQTRPSPGAYNNLGAVLADKLDWDGAESAYRQALNLQPDFREAAANLAGLLIRKNRFEEALQILRRVQARHPTDPDILNALGAALTSHGPAEEAVRVLRQAVAARPNFAGAHANLANALLALHRHDLAIEEFHRAIALDPANPTPHLNLGFTHLMRGDFAAGWPQYEWRNRVRDYQARFRQMPTPPWDGRELNGRSILLITEQGFGDFLQFARFIPMVKQRGGRVILECPEPLRRLTALLGAERLILQTDPSPPVDEHALLLSLPQVFGTTLETIPADVPYIFPDEEMSAAWKARLAQQPPGLKAGLVWAGRPTHSNDRYRSMPLAALASLAAVKGVNFFSLQKGDPAVQAKNPPPGMKLIDWTDQLGDFADTAALVWQLDLVICVDTAIAHLAGAMGKPVWLLLCERSEWRWMLDRTDSPWYPTMRLFRQKRLGDWSDPVADAARELEQLSVA